jgi:hypothetical protein
MALGYHLDWIGLRMNQHMDYGRTGRFCVDTFRVDEEP